MKEKVITEKHDDYERSVDIYRIHTHTFEHKTRCNTIILTMSEDDKTKFLKCFEQLKEEVRER